VQPDAIARGIPPDASEKARKLEDLGYATLTAPDRLSEFFVQMPAFDQRRRGDEKLRVGTNVLNNDFRHSVVVAREAATVDLLTVGRLRTAEDLRGILARSQHDPVNAPEAVNAIRFHLPTPIYS
jgi:alkanesulfonate monooxygenase SsuD/methylene tetrahydromethanopterin reductase-like flavin-dependent oxidoreductase (luciferase family)